MTEPSSGTVAVSNRYVDFFDDVGRRVAKECPDSVLSFYCYADYTQPPTIRPQAIAELVCGDRTDSLLPAARRSAIPSARAASNK